MAIPLTAGWMLSGRPALLTVSELELRTLGSLVLVSELELVCDLGCDVLESDGGARDALEPDPVEGEPGELADLDLPLDEGVRVGVAVDAQQQEPLALLVVAVVHVQHLRKKGT